MRLLILALLAAAIPSMTFATEPVELMKTMDGFEKEVPPAECISEMNGFSLQDINGNDYTMTRLTGVANRLGITTKAECMVLLTYLKHPDAKIRFIAARAIESAVHAYPEGMSANDMLKADSEGHRTMIKRFVEKIEKLPA
jgi:hypothetical protein